MKDLLNKTSGNKIPVIICIDVEPDGMFIDRTKKLPWIGYEIAYPFFNEMRRKIASEIGSNVHFSWFYRMDPQISGTYGSGTWPIDHYPEYIGEFEKRNDEIGVHTHLYRFNIKSNDWIIDNADQEWAGSCIRSSFEAFKKAFGRTCESHRFGDRFIDNASVALLEEMGAYFDLTIEPGFDEVPPDPIRDRITGPLPNMTCTPKEPYRCSKIDFKRSDPNKKKGLLMIPLTTDKIKIDPSRFFSPKRLFSLHLGLDTRYFMAVVNGSLKSLEKPYLGIVLKTDMLKDEHLVNNMLENLKFLTMHPLNTKFIFSTPKEAMKILGDI